MCRISTQLRHKLHTYVDAFSRCDEVRYSQLISNQEAEAFLADQIPLLDCPDPVLEEIYYFRWWTYRKHIRQTDRGHVITEFLSEVPWAGPENTIVCAAGFHIREGRWLRDPENWIAEYIRFWLEGHGDIEAYSTWLPHAVWEYCSLKDDFALGMELLPQMIQFFEVREAKYQRSCGLYWSSDDRDGMEYSISGAGFRPTLNAYACADARAIARFLRLCDDEERAQRFEQRASLLQRTMDILLWDEAFYKTIPASEQSTQVWRKRPAVPVHQNVREMVGYVPWYFVPPTTEKAVAFAALMDSKRFASPFGLTTADQSHPRFLEPFDHECLWNGYIWPFATSQTLVACANLLHSHTAGLTKETYYMLLRQYAQSQHRCLADGTRVPWIDENLNPKNGQWEARTILEQQGWQPTLGGYERGKDYNHSLFCDLILSGLLGLRVENGNWKAEPLLPDSWAYFRVENLWLHGRCYTVTYDRSGKHYHGRKGLTISGVGAVL